VDAKVQRIKNILEKDPSILLAILYGSCADGTAGKNSDIDIGITGPELYTPEKLADLNLELSKAAGRETDLIDLRRAGGMVLTQVLTTGEILKNTDKELYLFLIKKMHYFQADMAPNIRYILDRRREAFLNER